MRVGVTGAAGFVGTWLVRRLADAGHDPVPLVRHAGGVAVGDLADLRVATVADRIGPLDALIHLAARTASARADDEEAFRHANVGGTRGALAIARAAGARHVILASSVKVHGDVSPPGHRFDEESPRLPTDAYARSKVAAEDLVMEEAPRAGLDWTIVRPPLIYGPGAAANFARLARIAGSGVPLPLGGIGNRRSIVFVDNFADFILRSLMDPAARNDVFLVADGEDLSTSRLVRELAAASGAQARLVPIPARLIATLARAVGKGGLADRLFGDLAVSREKAERLLGWTPPVPLGEALRRTMAGAGGVPLP